MDGVNWATGELSISADDAGIFPGGPSQAQAAFIRLKLSFQAASSVVAACSFDIHGVLDKS